jgi:hypothetical protein
MVYSSIGRLVRTLSIVVRMKEEHQIRVRTEFGVERERIRVEVDRRRVREFWFVSIVLVVLNRPWHPIFIGWGGLTLIGLIKSIFRSLNRIRSI